MSGAAGSSSGQLLDMETPTTGGPAAADERAGVVEGQMGKWDYLPSWAFALDDPSGQTKDDKKSGETKSKVIERIERETREGRQAGRQQRNKEARSRGCAVHWMQSCSSPEGQKGARQGGGS